MKIFLFAVTLFVATLASAAPGNRRDLSYLSQPHQYYRHQQRYVAPRLRPNAEPLSDKPSFQLPKSNYGTLFRPISKPIIDLETDPPVNGIVDSYGRPITDTELISLWAARVPVPHTEYGVPKEYVHKESRQNYNAASGVYKASVPFYYVPDPVGFQNPFEQYQYA